LLGSTGGGDDTSEGTGAGTKSTFTGVNGNILVFKSKAVTDTNTDGTDGFATTRVLEDDIIIVHSQQGEQTDDTMTGDDEKIIPWNLDWVFSSGDTADDFFKMPLHWSAIRGRGGFGTGNAN